MRKHRTLGSRFPLVVVATAMLSITACDRSDRANALDSSGRAKVMKTEMSPPVSGTVASLDAPQAVVMQRAIATEVAASPAPAVAADGGEVPRETGSQLPPASDPAGAMLVRHGQASIEVRHVDDAVMRIRQASQQMGGFVANTALRNGKDEQPSASLELRVPTAQFDQLIAGLKAFGKVESVTANAEDVGEEYVDLGARAANARRVEARLVERASCRTC